MEMKQRIEELEKSVQAWKDIAESNAEANTQACNCLYAAQKENKELREIIEKLQKIKGEGQ